MVTSQRSPLFGHGRLPVFDIKRDRGRIPSFFVLNARGYLTRTWIFDMLLEVGASNSDEELDEDEQQLNSAAMAIQRCAACVWLGPRPICLSTIPFGCQMQEAASYTIRAKQTVLFSLLSTEPHAH